MGPLNIKNKLKPPQIAASGNWNSLESRHYAKSLNSVFPKRQNLSILETGLLNRKLYFFSAEFKLMKNLILYSLINLAVHRKVLALNKQILGRCFYSFTLLQNQKQHNNCLETNTAFKVPLYQVWLNEQCRVMPVALSILLILVYV